MPVNTFLSKVIAIEHISFNDTMSAINEYYEYTPTSFNNGLGENSIYNHLGTNEGSCKIFAFGKLNQLNKNQTLNLFGDFYHQEVLNDPDGKGHQNIRNFIQYGWEGIEFSQPNTLRLK